MPEDDVLKKIEARLARLEAGAIVDPVPFPGGGWGGGWGGWGGIRPPHGPIVDPAVSAAYRYQIPALPDWYLPPWLPHVDPATYAGAAAQQAAATAFFRRPGPIGDPPPIDVSRFSLEQLEAALHSINAEKTRLNSLETMIRQQLEKRQREG